MLGIQENNVFETEGSLFCLHGLPKNKLLEENEMQFCLPGTQTLCMYVFIFCIITLIKAILLYSQSSNLFEVSCIHLGTCILQRSPGLE